MTTRPPAFDILPTETITWIFELVCDSQLQDLLNCKARAENQSSFPHIEPFALAQISSRLRSIALGHAPLWRTVAQTILSDIDRKSQEVLQVLNFCARHSRHTLDRLDLRTFFGFWRCEQEMLELLGIAMQSATTLKELRLPSFLNFACNCQPCEEMRDDEEAGTLDPQRDVNTISFDLVSKAHSVEALSLYWSSLPPETQLSKQVTDIQARPKSLQVQVPCCEPLSATFLTFLSELASQTTELDLQTVGRLGEPNAALPELYTWVPRLVIPICSTLQQLKLHGGRNQLDLTSLFSYSFPVLEKLFLLVDDDEDMPPRLDLPPAVCHLPTLVSLEMPGVLVDYIDAPAVRNVALTELEDRDRVICIESLGKWSRIEDLVLHGHGYASDTINQILRAMIVSTSPCCPSLRRLNITGQRLGTDKWILDTAFDDLSNCGTDFQEKVRREYQEANGVPCVGYELVCLDSSRRGDDSRKFSSTDSSPSRAACWQLEEIRLVYCITDPLVHELLLKVTQCKTLWCKPEPHAFEASMRAYPDDAAWAKGLHQERWLKAL